MGNNQSEERKREKEYLLQHLLISAQSYGVTPDIGIDSSLVKYSGLNSAAELENSINQALKNKRRRIPDYLQSLGSALAAFEKIPTVVGLGAVAVSIALELILEVLGEDGESKDSTLEMMQRVFAEEKASGVRDSMEEYMKRLRMYLHQPTRALEETERLERQLSEQLTRLKNSMLHDNQMSSRSMKHWTNGAAFHLQMLVHAARLKMHNTSKHKARLQIHQTSITSVLDSYQFDLEELLQQYKTYKKSTILISSDQVIRRLKNPYDIEITYSWKIKDKEAERKVYTLFYTEGMPIKMSLDEYVDFMFESWSQIKELKSYFNYLKRNVNDLIIQNYEFNIHNVLPFIYNQRW